MADDDDALRHVQVLPDALANQIAAGEVVERPSSVVKELLENALDAGATTVFVDIHEGGRRLIRVVDDGIGMSREDASLCIERHATSKVRDVEDLRSIITLGFRGEALPSIASVSRFRLVTRAEGDIAGTEVTIEGGASAEIKDAGGPIGTRVEVADLFFNVPARLKFLKRNATEMGHITGLLTAAALGYPHVHFRLSHNGRVSLDHPVAPNLKQRIFQVLGGATTQRLHAVQLDDTLRVRGFISEPTHTRTNQRGLHTFINGRWVRDRVVNHAIVSAYGNLLERGRYPHAVLYLHLPPDEVDVNVHPTKAEVRFVQAGRVHDAIVGACRATLARTPWVGGGGAVPPPTESRAPVPFDVYGLRHKGGVRPPPRPPAIVPVSVHRPELPLEGEETAGGKPAFFRRLRVLGQADKTFLVCEGADGLYVIDQHAAHERVGYERIKSGYCDARLARQQLLFPLQLEFSPEESTCLTDQQEVLGRLGFDVEPFGGGTWQVTSVPALLAKADVSRLVRDVVAELTDLGQATLMEAHLELLFSTMACHSVVRAGDSLNDEEIRALLEQMDEVELGANCPHGRPVFVTVPFSELARKLHRT
ncbi:MAG: DNA mismatch repair endonuclease MutL [Myxococcota bacterium]